MTDAFAVLMGAAKKKKKTTAPAKCETDAPPSTDEPSDVKRNAFDLLCAKPSSAFESAKKKRRTNSSNSDCEEFTLSYDESSGKWSWLWVTRLSDGGAPPAKAPAAECKVDEGNDDDCTIVSSKPDPGVAAPSREVIADRMASHVQVVTETVGSFARKTKPSGSTANQPAQTSMTQHPPALLQPAQSPPQSVVFVAASALSRAAVSPQPREAEEPQKMTEWSATVRVRHMESHGCEDGHVAAFSSVALRTVSPWKKPAWKVNAGAKTYHLSLSLLKSMLQKSVRRCRPDAAVRIAAAMMRESFNEFIRRLTVIAVEDAIVHPHLPAVVWLMLAASSSPDASGSGSPSASGSSSPVAFTPSTEHVDLCLGVVRDIAACRVRDVPPHITSALHPPSHRTVSEIGGSLRPIVKSLLARAAYGGMKCDVAMLLGTARLWTNRFRGDPEGWTRALGDMFPDALVPVRHGDVGSIGPDDVALAAVDFHCTPILDKVLSRRRDVLQCLLGSGADVDGSARSAMWLFRSGVNSKAALIPEHGTCPKTDDECRATLAPLWSLIADDCDEWSYGHCTKHFW